MAGITSILRAIAKRAKETKLPPEVDREVKTYLVAKQLAQANEMTTPGLPPEIRPKLTPEQRLRLLDIEGWDIDRPVFFASRNRPDEFSGASTAIEPSPEFALMRELDTGGQRLVSSFENMTPEELAANYKYARLTRPHTLREEKPAEYQRSIQEYKKLKAAMPEVAERYFDAEFPAVYPAFKRKGARGFDDGWSNNQMLNDLISVYGFPGDEGKFAKGGQVKPKATYTTASVTPFEDDGLQGLTRKYEQVATYAKGGQVKGIVDTLKGMGVDSSFDYRTELFASLFPDESYVGSANQNNRLVAYLKGQYEAPQPVIPQPVIPQAQGLNVRQPLFERPAGEPYRPDPARDAIEGFYPEANLLAVGKVATGASVLKPHPSRVTTIMNREAKEAYQFAQRAKQYRQQHPINNYRKRFARGGVVGTQPELSYNPAEIEAITNQLAEEIYG